MDGGRVRGGPGEQRQATAQLEPLKQQHGDVVLGATGDVFYEVKDLAAKAGVRLVPILTSQQLSAWATKNSVPCAIWLGPPGKGVFEPMYFGCAAPEVVVAGPAPAAPVTMAPAPAAPAPTPAPAPSSPPPVKSALDAATIVAMPDHAARIRHVRALMVDPATAPADVARAGSVLGVLSALADAGRTDPAVVRGFVEAACSTDPVVRESAVAAAARGDLPPSATSVVVAGPAPAPTPVPVSLDKLSRYKSERLHLGAHTAVFGSVSQYGGYVGSAEVWEVYQGTQVLSSKEFAALTKDGAVAARLRKNATGFGVTGAVGVTAMVGGLIGMGTTVGSDTNITTLAVSGVTAIVGSVLTGVGGYGRARTAWPRVWWSNAAAEERARKYNAELRKRLELTEEDVREIELGR